MNIVEKKTHYEFDGGNYDAYLYYDAEVNGSRPGVVVVPEWWGLNDYTRSRAHQVAELGYAAIAIDVYGDGKQGNNPSEAQALANTYYSNMPLCKPVLEAAMNHFKTFAQVDPSKIAGIGYCFGGGFLLNAVRAGVDIMGIVSFHGGLKGLPPKKDLFKAEALICHGGADTFENDNVPGFHQEMIEQDISYQFHVYEGAQHAYSNPLADRAGKEFNMPISYNAAADKKSWHDMIVFLEALFKK